MMEEPELPLRPPGVLSPCSSGRRSCNTSSSPEFEFWMVRNPSFPQPNLLSADELFFDGVLLPLDLLQHHSPDDPPEQNAQETPAEAGISGSDQSPAGSGSDVSSVLAGVSAPAFSSSKRWKDIFKISGDRRSSKGSGSSGDDSCNNKGKEKKKEKKVSGGGAGNVHGVSPAELNINIWPFSRSRSAGNGGSRPRVAAGATRKVSSAPCSRSNSASESKSSRKWPNSPSRAGVHLGRSSPVWHVRNHHRSSSGAGFGGATKNIPSDAAAAAKNAEKGATREVNEARRKSSPAVSTNGGANGSSKAKALTLNVPMCIGYKHHLSCRSDENGAVNVVPDGATGSGGEAIGGGSGGSDEAVRSGSNLFNIRSLFTKKVH